MKVRTDHIAMLGGIDSINYRVEAFKRAIEAHKQTVGLPAPAEAGIIEILARQNETIEPYDEPMPEAQPNANHIIDALAARVTELERRMAALGK